ncbi:hypothetical protein BJX62DRAFT_62477 [Aspergillus germanicus]
MVLPQGTAALVSKDIGITDIANAGIIVGTPGTLYQCYTDRRICFSTIRLVVYEEAERLLLVRSGALRDIKFLIGLTNLRHDRCIFVLSAKSDEDTITLNRFLRCPYPDIITFQGRPEKPRILWVQTQTNIYQTLVELLKHAISMNPNGSCIVYTCGAKEREETQAWLSGHFKGCKVLAIDHKVHGGLRRKVIAEFMSTPGTILASDGLLLSGLCTDVTAAIFVGIKSFSQLIRACFRPKSKHVVIFSQQKESRRH